MRIRIKNKLVTEPVINMLYQAKRELKNGKLSDIENPHASNILISCPVHKDGFEKHASCRILADEDCSDLEVGYAYCFSCGYSAPFAQVIGDLFNEDKSFGEEWICDRFGNTLIQEEEFLQEIILDKPKVKKQFLDESILLSYDFYHPYMWKRKLSKEVVDRFRVGYDKERNAITFPVYDEKHNLVMITARSVDSKHFWIPRDVDKPVYLLYDILERGIDRIIITEGQLDALTAWTYGEPAVATMGCPSEKQINTLNKSGVRVIITMFDNDAAGSRFVARLKKSLNKDILLLHSQLPSGCKDINDLTKEQFDCVMSNLL